MKKNDIYLAGAIVLIALVWLLINTKFTDNGRYVSVYVNNEHSGKYDLTDEKEYIVFDKDGNNMQMFVIKNGAVDVVSAGCPDKLCMRQRAISKAGETIVCLPQKIVLKIEGDEADPVDENGVDAVTY